MNAPLEIALLGSATIREKAKEVLDIQSDSIQNFIDDLITTCKKSKGVGIAAVQVSESKAIFIIASEPNERYPHAPTMEPTAILNPKIISHSKEMKKDWEGCLSLPGIRGLVPRYTEIDVSYTNRLGEQVKIKYNDFIARVFQHEYDHLNGIVFIDRVESNKDIVMEAEYQKIVKSKLTKKLQDIGIEDKNKV